ncbi:MAG: hypothetical protein ABI721_05105 [Candidatus Dojkabacteria bacterium]
MLTSLFFTILRTVAIPYVAIIFLSQTALGEKGAFIAVTVTVVLVTIIALIWQVLQILGNTVVLRGGKVFTLIITIIIEIIAAVGFVIAYQSKFG